MENNAPEKRTPLTKEEKKKRLEEKIKQMKLQVKQIDSAEKRQERKDRARELIQIGAFVAQFHDRKKLLEHFRNNPIFIYINEAGETKKTTKIEDIKNKKAAVFIDPKVF